MSAASGASLPDVVADGLAGELTISVGVGTGGTVRDGQGDALALVAGADAGGTGMPGGGLGGIWDATLAVGVAGCDAKSTAVRGWVVHPRVGAAPIPPAAPTGEPAAEGSDTGAPRVQPTVTAKGSPSERMPKKMDLGESRTFRTPVCGLERLRRGRGQLPPVR
jgi:hypothetical protein